MTYMSLAQRIQLEQGQLKPSEVTELHLDHAKATHIEGLTSEFSSLEILSLSSVGLETLDGLPELPALKSLDLSSNKISEGFDGLLRCPGLEQLNLSANKIESMDVLTPLAKLSSLKKLDLFDCAVASSENYRKKVFALLPNLSYLDGLDENNDEEPTDQAANGEEEEADENGEGDDDDEEVNDESEEEEEYGIEALQRSGDLEDDDEEDYVPGEDEENDLDEYDDLDEEDDDVDEEDDGANLSGAGETGPRRPAAKRKLEAADDGDDAPVVKHKAANDEKEESVNNGSAVDN